MWKENILRREVLQTDNVLIINFFSAKRAKFPATTPSCSMAKIGRVDDSFLEVFEPQASPVEGQSLQQKEKKRRKRKGEKIEKRKFLFLRMTEPKCCKMYDSSGKKG